MWAFDGFQITLKLTAGFETTVGDLWDFYGLSVAFYKRVSIIMLQKSSARKEFCAEKSLAINRSSPLGEIRRLEILESKMVYTTRGK